MRAPPRDRTIALTVAVIGALGIAGVVAKIGVARAVGSFEARPARGPASAAQVTAVTELHVPHAGGAIVLDGDTDDPGWRAETARTGGFVGEGGVESRPYSDLRIVWGDGHLYVALYAADEDIRAPATAPDAPLWLGDAFHLVFTDGVGVERSLDVSPLGTLTDALTPRGGHADFTWQSGAHVSHEVDGTIGDPSDDDEEWVIEMAIPFRSLGMEGVRGERIGFSVRRCDTPKRAARVCASWGERGAPGVLVLD